MSLINNWHISDLACRGWRIFSIFRDSAVPRHRLSHGFLIDRRFYHHRGNPPSCRSRKADFSRRNAVPRRVSPPCHLLRRLSVIRLALGSIALGPQFCFIGRLTSFKSHSILFTSGKTKLTKLLSKFSFRSYIYMYYIDNLRSLRHYKIRVINSDYFNCIVKLLIYNN